MKRTLFAFAAGVVVASRHLRVRVRAWGASRGAKISLHSDDTVVMPELRWQCSYHTDGLGIFSGAPPGPELHCGRLGALTDGIRTHTDLYYVVVSRGNNSAPRIVFKARRP